MSSNGNEKTGNATIRHLHNENGNNQRQKIKSSNNGSSNNGSSKTESLNNGSSKTESLKPQSQTKTQPSNKLNKNNLSKNNEKITELPKKRTKNNIKKNMKNIEKKYFSPLSFFWPKENKKKYANLTRELKNLK